RIDPLEVPRVLDRAELALELVQLLELVHEAHRLAQAELLVAPEVVAPAHLVERQELAQAHRELAHLGLEPLGLREEGAPRLAELAPLACRTGSDGGTAERWRAVGRVLVCCWSVS